MEIKLRNTSQARLSFFVCLYVNVEIDVRDSLQALQGDGAAAEGCPGGRGPPVARGAVEGQAACGGRGGGSAELISQ